MKKSFSLMISAALCFCMLVVPMDMVYAARCPNDSCVYNAVISEEATCTHGNIWKYTCKKCGRVYYEDDGMWANEHQFEKVEAKEPTEQERGYIEHLHCTVCGRNFSVSNPNKELGSLDLEIPRIGGDAVVTSVTCDRTVVDWYDTITFRVEYTADEQVGGIELDAIGKNTGQRIHIGLGSEDEISGILRAEYEFDPDTWKGSVTYYRMATPIDAIDDYYFYVSHYLHYTQAEEVKQMFYDHNSVFSIRAFEGVDACYITSEDEDAIEKLEALNDEDTAVFRLWVENVFKKEYQDAIKGRDINVIIPLNRFSYSILNGKDIVNETKDIKVRSSLGGSGRADADDGGPWFALNFTFPNNGQLPGKIRYYYLYDYVYNFVKEAIDSRIITADDVMREMELYYISNGMLVLEPDSISTDQDWLVLELDHNSSFLASSFSPKIMRSFDARLSKTSFVYNGKTQKPAVKCNKSGYSAVYSNSKSTAIGSYKVTVKAPKTGYGTQTLKYTIKPPKVTGVKLTSPKAKQLEVKYTKAKGGVKYQVWYRVKGNSTWKKTTTKNTSKLIKSLKGGKTYQVKVRAYKKVNGTTYYGAWTAIKKLKVKK